MTVFAHLYIASDVAAKAKKALVRDYLMPIEDDQLRLLDADEIEYVLDHCEGILDTSNIPKSGREFHVPYLPPDFIAHTSGMAESCDAIVAMMATALTPVSEARCELARRELLALERGVIPQFRAVGTVVDGILIIPPGGVVYDRVITGDERMSAILKSLPGFDDNRHTYKFVTIVPRDTPFEDKPLIELAPDGDAFERCDALTDRIVNIAAARAGKRDISGVRTFSLGEPEIGSIFDTSFPILNETFRVRSNPSDESMEILEKIERGIGVVARFRHEINTDFEFRIRTGVVRATIVPADGPVTGILIECCVRPSGGGSDTEAMRSVFVPLE